MSFDRKAKGRQGEALVDSFFVQKKWNVYGKNIFFRGGEIDRVYYKNILGKDSFQTGISVCLAEIKYTQVLSMHHVESVLTPDYLAKFVKPRQVRNLRKFGENLEKTFLKQNSNLYLYARLFIVISAIIDLEWDYHDLCDLPGKLCSHSKNHMILSLEPDMVFGKVCHSLQISV